MPLIRFNDYPSDHDPPLKNINVELTSVDLLHIKYCIYFAALYNLEDNWRDIVRDSGMLTERQQQQQTAIWELVETEVTYIHTLRVLTDVSIKAFRNYLLLRTHNLRLPGVSK